MPMPTLVWTGRAGASWELPSRRLHSWAAGDARLGGEARGQEPLSSLAGKGGTWGQQEET